MTRDSVASQPVGRISAAAPRKQQQQKHNYRGKGSSPPPEGVRTTLFVENAHMHSSSTMIDQNGHLKNWGGVCRMQILGADRRKPSSLDVRLSRQRKKKCPSQD